MTMFPINNLDHHVIYLVYLLITTMTNQVAHNTCYSGVYGLQQPPMSSRLHPQSEVVIHHKVHVAMHCIPYLRKFRPLKIQRYRYTCGKQITFMFAVYHCSFDLRYYCLFKVLRYILYSTHFPYCCTFRPTTHPFHIRTVPHSVAIGSVHTETVIVCYLPNQ